MILGIALSITLYNALVLEPSAVVALEKELVRMCDACVHAPLSACRACRAQVALIGFCRVQVFGVSVLSRLWTPAYRSRSRPVW